MKYHLKTTRAKHNQWRCADYGLGFKCEKPKWLSFVISNAGWTVRFNFIALQDATDPIPQGCDLHFFPPASFNHPLHANRLITLLTQTGRETTATLSWQTIPSRSPEILGSPIWFHVTRDPARIIGWLKRASPGIWESPHNRNRFQKFHLQFKSACERSPKKSCTFKPSMNKLQWACQGGRAIFAKEKV